jgi:hypothetical protein
MAKSYYFFSGVTDVLLSHFNGAEIFGRVYLRAQTVEAAVNECKASGIFPANRQVFRDWGIAAFELLPGAQVRQIKALLRTGTSQDANLNPGPSPMTSTESFTVPAGGNSTCPTGLHTRWTKRKK